MEDILISNFNLEEVKAMNVVTIIPARSGSKGIPQKNIKLLNGVPLVGYSISYSLKSKLVNRTVVSTDSESIADICRNLGADVPFIRPPYLAEDDTQDFPVLKHALEVLENLYGERIDLFILLRPTSPLRPSGLIEKGLSMMVENEMATSLRSVSVAKEHPYRQWMKEGDFIKGYENKVFEPYNLPRQKIPRMYFQTGDIEIIRRSTLVRGSISGSNVLPLEIMRDNVVDIDTLHDWSKAEEKLKYGFK